jgi:predicted amidohydrolase
MKLICLQPDIAWQIRGANLAKASGLLDAAAPPAGSLLLLPEMFATGFTTEVDAACEEAGGATERFLADAARRRGITILAGVATRGTDGRGRNEAVAFGPDGAELVRFAKLHPFSFAGEPERFAPGDGIRTFAWAGFTVAPFVCYDLRFPESFRAAVRAGADLLAVLANWPSERSEHWLTLLRARAIENQAYVAGVNRCGASPHHAYPGRSLIIDPRGVVLADAGSREGAIAADLERPALEAYRRDFPALHDARTDGF